MNAEVNLKTALSVEGDSAGRKPRVAIMGEFSAGKSTLTNLLIGATALPVKITATQLPPVWISEGTGDPYRLDVDGTEVPIHMDDLSDIPIAETQFLRVFQQSDVLEMCDIIDMPGISDPNMSSEVWERVAHFADAVIWCTHATQAWRQSESAVWESFPEELFDKSLLLLTRFDKIIAERDRTRLVRRVEREIEGLFRGVYPISLLQALEAGEDFEVWQKSGADAFATALIELTSQVSATLDASKPPLSMEVRDLAPVVGAPETPRPPVDAGMVSETPNTPLAPVQKPAAVQSPEAQVMPRRVRRYPAPSAATRRPPREDAAVVKF